MFRPGRIIVILILALGGYGLFFQTPAGPRDVAAFDPAVVAEFETEAWKAKVDKSEFTAFMHSTQLMRELYRYTWFRALRSGFYESRVLVSTTEMTNRFERVMPDLEAGAAIEQSWTEKKFDPAQAARARLNWIASSRIAGQDSSENIASLMADDFAQRYGVAQDRVAGFAEYRTQAIKLRDTASGRPDWDAVKKTLTEGYRSLKAGLTVKR